MGGPAAAFKPNAKSAVSGWLFPPCLICASVLVYLNTNTTKPSRRAVKGNWACRCHPGTSHFIREAGPQQAVSASSSKLLWKVGPHKETVQHSRTYRQTGYLSIHLTFLTILSIYPSILSIHPSYLIHLSFLSIYPSFYLSFNPSIHLYFLSIHLFTYPFN